MVIQTQLKELFDYREDGNLLWKVSRKKVKKGRVAGTWHRPGYTLVTVDGKRYLLHRLIFLYHHGYLPTRLDHIDRDPSNNRIENLRPITQSQNIYNSKIRKNKTSAYRGVSKMKSSGKWVARITVDRTSLYIGTFIDEYKAGIAYNMAVIKYGLTTFIPLNPI